MQRYIDSGMKYGYYFRVIAKRIYRGFAFIGAFLIVAVQSLSAMPRPAHMSGAAQSMPMACCNGPASQVTPLCAVPGTMANGASCSCQETPASETSQKAVVPAPVPVMEAIVMEIFAQQTPEATESECTSEDPPDLHPGVPIFLLLRTLLI